MTISSSKASKVSKASKASGAMAGAAAPALWQQLHACAQALEAVCSGHSTTGVLAAVPVRVRPGVQALLFHVLRYLGRAQALRHQLASRHPPPAVDALLCCALALGWDAEQAPYDVFTLVNQTVEAAKRGPARHQAAFINACLRRFVRERAALVAATDADPVARWNHPAWWIERVRQDYPTQWTAILQANNAAAPMTLRVNRKKCAPAQYQQALAAIDLGATAVGDVGLRLHQPVPVERLPGWHDGWVSVQDAAAQRAIPLLLDNLPEPEQGQPVRVLDACAAPGGKTAHLLEYADGPIAVTALEVDAARCQRIHDTLGRLGLNAQVLHADASQPQTWWPSACASQPFDAIMLDAPCTASGIVRRHPDVRWLRRASDVTQLAHTQQRLLEALWPLLRPGGRLLYCTCSIFHAEGCEQIAAFISRHSDARALAAPGHVLPGVAARTQVVTQTTQTTQTLTQTEHAMHEAMGIVGDNADLDLDHDGFFYALLYKMPPMPT